MGHDDNHNYENDEMCRKWMNMYLFMYVIMYLMIYLYISTYIKCFNLGNLALHTILALHLINKLMIKWIYKNNMFLVLKMFVAIWKKSNFCS